MSASTVLSDVHTDRWPIRVWPGVVLVAVVAFCLFVPVLVAPQSLFHFLSFVSGPVATTVLAVVWWTAFARTTRPERVWVPVLFVLPAFAVAALDVLNSDTPMLPLIFGLPFVLTLWVGWLAVTVPLAKSPRLLGLAAVMTLGWVAVGMVRIDGTDGDMWPRFALRFAPRPEDVVKAELDGRKLVTAATPLTAKPTLDWPAFRGPNRDSVVPGVGIDTDWAANPPKLVWKQKIGPGWGTFAVVGDRLFTQEQRGEDEMVVCYDAATGGEIWRHAEKARFYEQIAQAGPRATPTVVDGKLYAQGATGILVCLNAEDGKLKWRTDIKADTGGKTPDWGYASSPLVLTGKVIVYTGGPDGKGTSAFDADTGKLAWSAGQATHGYSSAHRVVIAGVEQALMLSDHGLEAFDPATGKVLWEHAWPVKGMNRVTQPTVVGEGDYLIGTGVGQLGTKRLKVTKAADGWAVEEVWFNSKVHPYFNDGVVHDGHFYGFASKSLVCVAIADGSVVWNAGQKYGHGQVLLLAKSGTLLVQAVDGKVHLVKASPAEYVEEAKFQVISGKTWNHPVVANGRLFVRNGTEAACYELKIK